MIYGNMLNKSEYKLTGCYIEITSLCNLRCRHCYNDSGELTGMISADTFEHVLRCYNENTDVDITISGGEPLMHPNFWELVDNAIKSGVKKLLVITNATLIDDNTANEFIKRPNVGVQVSVNGSCAEVHDALCGNGSFARTVSGLKRLIDRGHTRLVARITLCGTNKHDILNTVNYLVELGVNMITIGSLKESGRAKDYESAIGLSIKELQGLAAYLKENKRIKELVECGYKIDTPVALSGGCPLIRPSEEEIPLNPRIDSKGNVFICQSFNDRLYSVGNISDESLDNVLKQGKFERLINFCFTGLDYMHACSKCVWRYHCGRGCVADVLETGSIQNTDASCAFKKIEFADNLIAFQVAK